VSDMLNTCAAAVSNILEAAGSRIPNHGCWVFFWGEAECPAELLEIE